MQTRGLEESSGILLPKLTFILGGAASGKSNYAESLAKTCDHPRIYIATAQAFDDEMRAKIARHRNAREADGWRTVEEPFALARAIGEAPGDHLVLVDCLTLWLSNVMLAQQDRSEEGLIDALAARRGPTIVVSNEVGQGLVPETPLGRRFREAQGGLNRRVAGEADLVVAVMAGLPLALKGRLP